MLEIQHILDRIHAEAFAGAADAMLVVDGVNGCVLHANPAAGELTGYTLESLAGKHVGDLLPSELRDEIQARLRATVAQGGRQDLDLVSRRADGQPLPLRLRVHVMADEERPLLVVHVRDDAERGELATALAQANEEVLAARRTAADKNRFFAGMTHELRTPLNAVLGLTELLSHMEMSDEARDTVRMLRRSGDVLLRLINDILDLSKIEAGKLDIEQAPFDLHHVVSGVAEVFAVQCAQQGIDFSAQVAPGTPERVMGDEVRLRQVLANLLDNALKFTAQGGVTLAVRPVPADDGPRVEFRVTDTGIGIPAERLDDLFEPYTQAAGDTTRKYGGTGLGLTICSMLVGLMGGRIGVESEPGRGSTFWFDVDLREAPRAAPDTTGPVPAAKGEPLRILLVEDNRINQRVAMGMLDKLGHATRPADDGAAALAALAETDFDLVFMDVQLPDLSGLEVTRRLRAGEAGERNRAAAVVAMTAHATRQDRQTCLDAGMDDYVAKPISTERLVEVIRRVREGGAAAGGPCDVALLVDQLDGDAELAREILEIFLEDAHERIGLLAEAVRSYDFDTVSREAKTLEGAALNVHAHAVVTLLGELMAAARNKEEEYAASLVAELREQVDAVAACI